MGTGPLDPINGPRRGHGWRLRQSELPYLIVDLVPNCCDIQVYTLEKVLKMKKDPISQVVFLDEAMKVGPVISPRL